jgi:hypothetical protein
MSNYLCNQYVMKYAEDVQKYDEVRTLDLKLDQQSKIEWRLFQSNLNGYKIPLNESFVTLIWHKFVVF